MAGESPHATNGRGMLHAGDKSGTAGCWVVWKRPLVYGNRVTE